MRSHHLSRCVALMLCLTVLTAGAALKVKFTNANPDYSASNVYVMFRQGSTSVPFAASCQGSALALTTAYSFAQLADGVWLTSTMVGVFYVSLGKPMTVPVTNIAGVLPEPSLGNVSDPDYATRWDTVEITFTGSVYDAANLTGINKFALPFSLRTFLGIANIQTLGYHDDVNVDHMISMLAAAATNDTAVLRDASNNFLRVIGPTTYAAGTIGPYRPLDAYVAAVRTTGRPILISDLFTGSGGTPRTVAQRYEFTTTFTNLAGTDVLYMLGGSPTAGGIGMGHVVTYPYSNIAYQIYANDPHYTIDGVPNASMADNDVYAAAVRDVFAGFACGFVGCTATDQVTQLPFYREASSNWFAGAQTQAFSDVQTVVPYFNGYGEAFWRYSDVYGFPFADRLHSPVQANLNPALVDTLEIVVQSDVIPEPGVLTWIVAATGVCVLRRPRRTAAG